MKRLTVSVRQDTADPHAVLKAKPGLEIRPARLYCGWAKDPHILYNSMHEYVLRQAQ